MSERPIFVVGCPRSGTTMLQLMLHAHPRVAVPPETRILVQAYRDRRQWGDLRRPKNRRALARWIAKGPRTQFEDLGVDKDEFIRRAVAGPGSLGSVVGLVYAMFAERHGKIRWGDKRPPYIRHLDAVLAMFPDAQIVHLIRDGRDCVASLKEMPWFKGDISEAVYRWAEAIDIGRGHKLPPDSYYELRYEDLCADPTGTLTGLCTFIGEEYDPAMREPYRVADVVPAHKEWHVNTRQAVTTTRAGSWSSRLDPDEVSLCETVLGSRLTAYGYELTGAPRAPRRDLTAYEKTASSWRRELRRTALVERINRFREPGPVAALLTNTQRELAGVPK
ncbi:sulfotransferase [Acrocarpospora pleiomorpha]|uniref:Sulfotransferase n=1 Tax=Acrocarpospora pleiomorpha TaxID=90975 RepID=A0A5M3XQC7_9ACTN|nr:sulfotransferase [Acrocarpospora pleiomorpha]GES23527.1 sulfotransferase [Acrocarpospora pleiomorpha]